MSPHGGPCRCSCSIGAVFADWQQDSEYTSSVLLAYKFNSSAVRLDRPSRDRETQTHAAAFAGTACIHTVEALEDAPLMCGGNPGSTVLHLDGGISRTYCLQYNADGTGGRRIFYRIVYQV